MTHTQKQNVPKLRFPGFEGAWGKTTLGAECNITTGRLDANAMVHNGQYPFFTCAREVYKIDTPAFDTEALLISGNGANVGYIHYYHGKFNAYQRTYVLDGFTQEIHFIERSLERDLKKRIFSEVKEGNTPYIVKGTLADMQINLPTPPEQRKIANFLGAVDEKITQLSRKKALLEDYKKGCMQQIFSQKIRFRDEDGNDFPNWEEKRLEEIFCEVVDKVGKQKIPTYSISAGKGWVSQKEKFGRDISGQQNERYTALQVGDFAYNKGNSKTYKYGCVYPNNTDELIAVPNVFISFRPVSVAISVGFYAKLFEHHFLDRGLRQLISSGARMDGLLNVNKGEFFKLKVPLPHPTEQRKIADFLSALDRKIDLVDHELTHACVFRRIRPPIPTTSGHLFRGIRPPVTRCREAAYFGYQS